MDIIYLLLPVALIIVIIIIGIFFWAVKSDQFDDLDGPAYRILMDDDTNIETSNNSGSDNKSDNQNENTISNSGKTDNTKKP